MPKVRRKKRRFTLASVLLLATGLWLGQWHVRGRLSSPTAALVLGGDAKREEFAAQFAIENPDIDLWISSGANPEYSTWVFQESQVPLERLHLDYRAVDTVTNFTTLVDDFDRLGIKSVYLITSDYHMRRATTIAAIVLGSRGIHYKPLPVTSERPPEPLLRSLRDGGRSILWVFTGKTGSELVQLSSKLPARP
ncbi:YdcF family protein [Leptothoe spongobia]|uniref:YdcF family protein n=1 Tax=Leptothoe spongobia TAU-MAC 1115 TaxID=1967444 RepID=A0A947DDX7_9CYAN|nr:ElyC/SanA/YdcF family protein [Leptothoe spongobia]MBT9315322.1 YdcF family protein [Leptothoe spongobia TAU-MAC 1115]